MKISFHKETYEARILDPSEGFEEKKLVVEVRTDPSSLPILSLKEE
ncbi:MAG: hypothetical protein JRH08_19120 [Deltaproteobacteria bacterium]|nr:hypothetical protein [Deltaproteobacteria bacterium]